MTPFSYTESAGNVSQTSFGTSHVEVSDPRACVVDALSKFLIMDITRKRYSVGLAYPAARGNTL